MINRNDIVIDSGSSTIKAGFGGESLPISIFSTTILNDNNNNNNSIYQNNEKKLFVGTKSINPIQNNKVMNWDIMEKLWEYTFNDQLKVNSKECNIHLCEPSFTPKNDREKTTEIMFEKFETQSIYISLDAVLTLESIGEKTGCVIDSGYDVTNIVPIYNGYKINHGVSTLNIGGKHVTKNLEQLLKESGSCGSINIETVNDIKEKLCYIVKDYNNSMYGGDNGGNSGIEFKSYQSSKDGVQVSLFKELFNAPEILFQPELFDLSIEPIHKKVYKSLQAPDIDIRKDIYESIYLVGGNTLIQGFAQRLINELTTLAPKNTNINIITLNKYSSWIGASKLCDKLTSNNLWIKKDQYDEFGPSIINKLFN